MGRLAERRARRAPRTLPGRAAVDPAREPLHGSASPVHAVRHEPAARITPCARTTVDCFRSWLVAEGWHEVEVDADLRIRHATRGGLAMLGAALGTVALCASAPLPAGFGAWLRRTGGAPAGVARAVGRGPGRLTLRALPTVDGNGWLVYVGARRSPAPAVPVALPVTSVLSPREREVLAWVGAGKTDAQAAAILGISVRTVQKHLENTYVKLGVEGRMAAVMRVQAADASH